MNDDDHDEVELSSFGTILDTWGLPCANVDCSEPMRTAGLEFASLNDDGEVETYFIPLCEEHFMEAVRTHVFERKIVGVFDEDGTIIPLDEGGA